MATTADALTRANIVERLIPDFEKATGIKADVVKAGSGALTLGKGILQNLASLDPVQVPVGFYLIRHPKGNVLFDTGNNADIFARNVRALGIDLRRLTARDLEPLLEEECSSCRSHWRIL